MPDIQIPGGVMTVAGDYLPGDQPPPTDYLGWHEWAEVQHKAGLRQQECAKCGRWKYPQEISDQLLRWNVRTSKGDQKTMAGRICNDCNTDA